MEERRDLLGELEGEDELAGWETTYRTWKLGFTPEKDEPRIFPVNASHLPWEPNLRGEVESDFRGTPEEFKTSSQGLYSLRSLDELRSSYGHEGVTGALIPFGTVEKGSRGIRSTHARIKHFYVGTPGLGCSICREPAKMVVYQKGDRDIILCDTCRKNMDKVLDNIVRKGGVIEEYSMEDLLEKLAEIYETNLEKWPY